MTGRLEAEILAGILGYLETRGDCFFWRNNSGGMKTDTGFIKFGIPGAHDIIGVKAPGAIFTIECKREHGGKISPDQIWFGEQITNHGGIAVVARSVEDVRQALGEPTVRVVKTLRRKRVYPR